MQRKVSKFEGGIGWKGQILNYRFIKLGRVKSLEKCKY